MKLLLDSYNDYLQPHVLFLNKEYKDPNITIKPASKNHIILHLGYTFGKQSHDIIKPVLMLFGDKARSLNILGKCGGLTGKRSDIIVVDSIFTDKTHELVSLNVGELGLDTLKSATKCDRTIVNCCRNAPSKL